MTPSGATGETSSVHLVLSLYSTHQYTASIQVLYFIELFFLDHIRLDSNVLSLHMSQVHSNELQL